MPLYEFYCKPCHTVFTFRSARVDTVTVPSCPKCGKALKREVSKFAHIIAGESKEQEHGDFSDADINGARMEEAASRLGDRLGALEDDDADPREAVRVMRELADAGGLRFNKEVREAMARIESGEDPEKIDEEFGEVFDTENPFEGIDAAGATTGRSWLRQFRGPARDPKWYDMGEG